ncbi:MAG: class I SAM-dependent methyltransferase [Saprospiraceae bacterium]|nr:class I SAM-dependent methyltransferase [Saprospiraceae bacterium]
MSHFFKIRSLWKYYRQARTRYDVHSPYLSDLVESVIRNRKHAPIFDSIEAQRKMFLRDQELIRKQPFGAGSHAFERPLVKVSKVAEMSLAPRCHGMLYHHLASMLRPRNVLELGTSLGISTAYLFSGWPHANLVSLEGDENLVSRAAASLQTLFSEQRPKIVLGAFSQNLPWVLAELRELDLVLIDGDHRYQATLDYYQQIKPYLSKHAIVVIHDIHWSAGMSKAWSELQKDKEVKLSVDLYKMGLLCRSEALTVKQSYTYLPWMFKPWRVGLF